MEAEEGRQSDSKRRSGRLFWRLFPHIFLILSLILYAILGAVIFENIEAPKNNSLVESDNIGVLVRKVIETVQNHTDASTEEALFGEIQTILTKFRKERENQTWGFYDSLFFCCTVFTTVGYGQMYPVTPEGRIACILYAMVGIPLMLLVISDVGDILAFLLSKGYTRLSLFLKEKLHRSCIHRHERATSSKQVQSADTDGTYMFSQDVVVHEASNIQQVIKTQSSLKHTSLQIRKNKEIFDDMIIKENFKLKIALTRSRSCPDINRVPPTKADLFTGIRQDMDNVNVPLLVILLVVFAYMLICSQILRIWENMKGFEAFYFTFITLTTIGFGDIVPEHRKYFMVNFLFIIAGMAIMSMAFKLGQSQIVSLYRHCIKYVSMGKVEIHKDLDSN